MSDIQDKVLADIKAERESQDEKWGIQDHIAQTWACIIGEEYGEMCKAVNEFSFGKDTQKDIYNEAIQTAASCVALCEHMRRVKAI